MLAWPQRRDRDGANERKDGALERIREWLTKGEEGHAMTLPPLLLAAAGAIVLACAATEDSDVWTIVGGIVLAVGLVAASLANHMVVDYDMYARIEKLEGKK